MVTSVSAWAQSNFIPLEPEDIQEKEDRWAFSPGLKLSGDYRARFSQIQSGETPGDDTLGYDVEEPLFEQDLRLKIASTMHRHLSLVLEIETVAAPYNDADLRNQSLPAHNRRADSQVHSLQARQAYLEYRPNPNGYTRLGKQLVAIGDPHGKVFLGILSGLAHHCLAGTWCYELNLFKSGTHSSDWIYHGSLAYSFFESKNQQGEVESLFRVKVFRMFYTERDIPLGLNNGPVFRDETRDASDPNVRQVSDQAGNFMAYDAFRQEYFGLQLDWKSESWEVYWDLISNQGRRKYHVEEGETGTLATPELGSNTELFKNRRVRKDIAGIASELKLQYTYRNHQFRFLGLFASGDKQRRDSLNEGDNYLRSLSGFHEISPGNYRGPNFYFNGQENRLHDGSGLGHSINNTILFGFQYEVHAAEAPFRYELGLFSLNRHRSVLNVEGERVKEIGYEFDNTFAWIMDKHLELEAEVNAFLAGEAFAYDDYLPPIEKPEQIFQFVLRARYAF